MKIKFLSIVLILCGLSLASCSNDDEIFSCDPEANEWAKENLSDIRKMTRGEWLKVNEQYQKAAFSAFTSEQKHTFWTEKITEILTLDWTEKEKSHIYVIVDFLRNNPDMYERRPEKEDEIFFYKWLSYAKEELKWDATIIKNMLMDGNQMEDTKGQMRIYSSSNVLLKSGSENNNKPDCNCGTGLLDKSCDLTNPSYTVTCEKDKNKKDCKGVDCGFLDWGSCDGYCMITHVNKG